MALENQLGGASLAFWAGLWRCVRLRSTWESEHSFFKNRSRAPPPACTVVVTSQLSQQDEEPIATMYLQPRPPRKYRDNPKTVPPSEYRDSHKLRPPIEYQDNHHFGMPTDPRQC